MLSRNVRKLLKYGVIGGVGVGTAISLHANNYELNSVGVVRLGRAACTVFDISLKYKTKLYGTDLDKESQEYLRLKSTCHQYAAEKLLKLCCTNKGVYIKVGQHLAALDYLLPKEYVQTMKILHSHAPTNSLDVILKVIREDLKCDPSDVYKSIDPEPLGTASLAQVHRATLLDGTVVAVKVQHPYVRGNSAVDMKTMEVLVKLVSWVFPDFKFQWLVDETKKNIPKELDFYQEGENAERLAQMFGDYRWLRIPAVHWDLTTPRVLTMDFVDGGQVNDVEYIKRNGINPFEIADKLGMLYSQMIFINGFVHSDPHPGNILVKKNIRGGCDIILLDHGLYANLSREFQTEYAKLWLSILNVDRVAMRLHCTNLGIRGDLYGLFTCMVTGRTWDTVLSGVDKTQHTTNEKEMFQEIFPSILPQISGVLQSVNRQMLLILKTNDLMRGIEHTLGTQARMNSFKVMSRYCIKSVYRERLDQATNRAQRLKIFISQYWILLKFTLYYTVLNLSNHCRYLFNK